MYIYIIYTRIKLALRARTGPLWAGPLWAPLGPCGPPWALSGWALVDPPGPLGAGPLWASWALVDPPGTFWAGPLRAPLGPCGPRPLDSLLGLTLKTQAEICVYMHIYMYIHRWRRSNKVR